MGADHQGRRHESGMSEMPAMVLPATAPDELFHAWTPDKANRQRILVDNSATLYVFPN
jgi:hypothetical protein